MEIGESINLERDNEEAEILKKENKKKYFCESSIRVTLEGGRKDGCRT